MCLLGAAWLEISQNLQGPDCHFGPPTLLIQGPDKAGVPPVRHVHHSGAFDRSTDNGCMAMQQDQNTSGDAGPFSAQEFSAREVSNQDFSASGFSETLLSLSSVWASGWMTQISRLNAFISKDSPLYKHWKKEADKKSQDVMFTSITHSLGALGLSGGVLGCSYVGATAIMSKSAVAGSDVAALIRNIEGWLGAEVLLFGLGSLIAMTLLVVGYFAGLRVTLANKQPEPDMGPKRFSDLLRIKPNQIHFGNLQVGYQVSGGKLVVRSLGDEFYAVFKPDIVKIKGREEAVPAVPELATTSFSDPPFSGWYGEQYAPPLVIEVKASGQDHASQLIIHGLQFEAPGENRNPQKLADKTKMRTRVLDFADELFRRLRA
jgi:hypothetical protein